MTGPEEIAPGLWWVPTMASNAYLWRTVADTLVVVDPGLDDAPVRDAIVGIGAGLRDIEAIVLTHFHSDHAGSAAVLADASGAPVCAGHRDAEVLRGHTPAPLPDLDAEERPRYERIAAAYPRNMAAPRCAVDIELEHGDPVDREGEIIVEAATGHTWGSVALHIPHRSALITGDVAISTPAGSTVPGPFNVDRVRARRALRRLAALDPAVAGLGHGRPLLHDAGRALQQAAWPPEEQPAAWPPEEQPAA